MEVLRQNNVKLLDENRILRTRLRISQQGNSDKDFDLYKTIGILTSINTKLQSQIDEQKICIQNYSEKITTLELQNKNIDRSKVEKIDKLTNELKETANDLLEIKKLYIEFNEAYQVLLNRMRCKPARIQLLEFLDNNIETSL
ncbi:7545_t:CDS:1 [Ambispora gerdemannii]|uniref:7545_t:CDS:1 n=1 Tax=Ambispora gerdemannii TaxID=144530 RepID=A0A9N9C8B5_9GLOM|nr:7545_t:CDS:1 [Ambispora gerdemannii]